ncbi:MAG: hypothetical protein JXR46_13085 [Calditrichaceae bacterium]|nr:hypothetical protein [Calditrichaceae bacterium]
MKNYINKFFSLCAYPLLKVKKVKTKNTERITNINYDSFVGYYNINPVNSNKYLLFHRSKNAVGMPVIGDQIDICYVDLKEKVYKDYFVCKTNAWSWQQGAMLQWIKSYGDNSFICNDYRGGKYYSKVVDIYNGVLDEFDLPIYTIDNNKHSFLTLDYDRLHFFRPGYGYFNNEGQKKYEKISSTDGIWEVDMKTKAIKKIVSTERLLDFNQRKEFSESYHYVNHIEYSPSGDRFIFFHLWIYKNKRYSRLFLANRDGSGLRCIIDTDAVSHYTWINNDNILIWMKTKDGKENYYKKCLISGCEEIFIKGILTTDGHPSYSQSGHYYITDTYPDKYRNRNLYKIKEEDESVVVLGKFFTPYKYRGPYRCDLHPRIIGDSDICIDSTHEGKRAVYLIK